MLWKLAQSRCCLLRNKMFNFLFFFFFFGFSLIWPKRSIILFYTRFSYFVMTLNLILIFIRVVHSSNIETKISTLAKIDSNMKIGQIVWTQFYDEMFYKNKLDSKKIHMTFCWQILFRVEVHLFSVTIKFLRKQRSLKCHCWNRNKKKLSHIHGKFNSIWCYINI